MKIICSQEKLNRGLNIVKNAVGKSNQILECILISTIKDKIQLSATNLEFGIKYCLSAEVAEKGSVVIPSKLFTDFISNLPKKDIELSAKKRDLKIKCGRFKSEIKGLSRETFPQIPKIEDENPSYIKQSVLKESLARVIETASESDSRPEISGIFLNPNDNYLNFAATDSFRLAEKIIFDDSKDSNISRPIIFPRRAAQELLRILDENSKEDTKIFLGKNQVLFSFGKTKFISRLIDGQYPDYKQIIPSEFETNIIVDRKKLISDITVASFFAERTNEIKLNVDAEKSKLKITSESIDRGKNESLIDAKIDGKSVEVFFNYKYVIDGLNNIFTDKVKIQIEKEPHKTIFSPIGDNKYLYLIMPLKK